MSTRWDSPDERLTRDVEVRGTEALCPWVRKQTWCPRCGKTIIDPAVMAACLDCGEGRTQ